MLQSEHRAAPGDGAPIRLAFSWTACGFFTFPLPARVTRGGETQGRFGAAKGTRQSRMRLPQLQFGDNPSRELPRSGGDVRAGRNDAIASHPDYKIPRNLYGRANVSISPLQTGSQGCSVCTERSRRMARGLLGCLCKPGITQGGNSGSLPG